MRRSITFYSEGLKLDGDLFLPDDLRSGKRRGGIVLAHGYTGARSGRPQEPESHQHAAARVHRRDAAVPSRVDRRQDPPRPILFITTDDDRLVPPEESPALFDKAREPKSLIVLRGFGHYEVYTEPAFSQVMAPTVAWFERFMPACSDDGGTALSA
jgi:fermentation-respiration switch protein FrsA (DUF1100 family)